MLTEQDVRSFINEKIAKEEDLKETSKKCIEKLKVLDEIIKAQTASLEDMRVKSQDTEQLMRRNLGAVYVLLEMVAEEEGLLITENLNNSNNTEE